MRLVELIVFFLKKFRSVWFVYCTIHTTNEECSIVLICLERVPGIMFSENIFVFFDVVFYKIMLQNYLRYTPSVS